VKRANDLAIPELTSQVLTMSVMANFEWQRSRRTGAAAGTELEDREADIPFQFRASAINMMTLAWRGCSTRPAARRSGCANCVWNAAPRPT
jgi:hypothetical protein